MVAQFIMLHSSFGTEITITAIRCGHPGQNKTNTLEKVEGLKKLERIEGPRLQESKMSEGTDVIDARGMITPRKIG